MFTFIHIFGLNFLVEICSAVFLYVDGFKSVFQMLQYESMHFRVMQIIKGFVCSTSFPTPGVATACYRPHTEYDGKVMFSVCLSTGPPPTGGGAPGVPPELAPPGYPPELGGHPWGYPPTGGRPRGYPPNWGGVPGVPPRTGGGTPGGTPPNKKWTKKWTNILETFGGGGRGRYASCGHAGGLSWLFIFFNCFFLL